MEAGDLVYMKKPKSSIRSKLDSLIEGPYRIVKWVTRTTALLEDGQGQQWTRHMFQLASCRPPARVAAATAHQHAESGECSEDE